MDATKRALPGQEAVRRFTARVKTDVTNLFRLVARYPSTALYPLVVLALVIGVGVWGITRVAVAEADSSKSRCSALAIEVASSFRQQLSVAASPLLSLAALVHYNPHYAFLASIFPSFAADLAARVVAGAVRSLQLSPQGVVRLVHPVAGNMGALGLDLFGVASERDGAVKTVADRVLTLVGPMAFKQGGFGVRLRLPIFVNVSAAAATANGATVTVLTANGSTASLAARQPFGGPDALNAYCGAPCAPNAATGDVFWGFATALIDLGALASSSDSRLAELAAGGYVYRLSAPAAAPELRLIAASRTGGRAPGGGAVRVPIQLPNNEWLLEVAPASGAWRPTWYAPLLAGLVVLGMALAAVLFAALVSRRQHQVLLEALLPRELIRDLVSRDAASIGPRMLVADAPADVLLKLLGSLLSGEPPDLRDVLLLRTTVARHADFYTPLNLGGQMRDANLDADVARALMRQLGGLPDAHDSLYDGLPEDAEAQMAQMAQLSAARQDAADADADGGAVEEEEYDTLTGALALILTPQPAAWYDSGLGGDGATSDAALPALGTECSLPSPSPSMAGGVGGTGGNSPFAPPAMMARARQCSLTAASLAAAGSGSERPSPRRISRELSAASAALGPPTASAALHRGSANGLALPPPGAAATASANIFLLTTRPGAQPGLPARPATQPGLLNAPASLATSASGGGGAAAAALDDGGGRLTPPHGGADAGMLETAISAVGPNGIHCRAGAPTAPAVAEGSASQGLGGGPGAAVRTSALLPPAPASVLMPPGSPAPRSPLGVFRSRFPRTSHTSLNTGPPPQAPQAPPPPPQSAILNGGGGGGAAADNSAFSLSATFSGNLTQLCAALPEDRPSSRFLVGNAAHGANGVAGAGGLLSSCGGVSGSVGGGVGGGGANGTCGGGGAVTAVALRRLCMPPPAAFIQEVERLLARADGWQFDTWGLQEASGGHALSCLGFYLIQRAGLLARFRIKPVCMARLLRHIEAGYIADNPYHNAVHAADVLQTLHVILHGAQLHAHYLDQLGLLAAYFAAIIHDYGHPGVTNDFLIATTDPLALRYNDRSPLENHHAAAAFCALRRPELDVTAGLSAAERAAFRKLVIDLVLATDMKQHFAVLGHFNTVHRLAGFAATGAAAAVGGAQGGLQAGGAAKGGGGGSSGEAVMPQLTRRSSRNLSAVDTVCTLRPTASDLAPKPKDNSERMLGLQVAMKAADLGHLGEELAVHKRWLAGLEEEFFRQGDRERELGLPISPLFDRAKQGVSKSQVGFYEFVALPLVHALTSAFPSCSPLMKCFVANYNHWRAVEAGGQPAAGSRGGATEAANSTKGGGGGCGGGGTAATATAGGNTNNGSRAAAATTTATSTAAAPLPPPAAP